MALIFAEDHHNTRRISAAHVNKFIIMQIPNSQTINYFILTQK